MGGSLTLLLNSFLLLVKLTLTFFYSIAGLTYK